MSTPDRYGRRRRREDHTSDGGRPGRDPNRLLLIAIILALGSIPVMIATQAYLAARTRRALHEVAIAYEFEPQPVATAPSEPPERERFTMPDLPDADPRPAARTPRGTPADPAVATRWSLLFNGRDSWIRAAGLGWHLPKSFTAEVWIRNWRGPVFSQGSSAVEGEPGVWFSVDDSLECGWTSADGRVQVVRTGGLPRDAWTHLALVMDGGEQKLFINGALKARATADPPAQVYRTNQLEIGRAQSGGAVFHGSGILRNLRISHIARYSESFVPETYLGADAGTLVAYDLTEGSGPITVNALDRGHRGVIQGARWIATRDFPH